jgi:hypothetical protein
MKNRSLTPILLGVLYAAVMGIIWALMKFVEPDRPAVPVDPGAYITAAIVGLGALLTFNAQEKRIQVLEERLRNSGSGPSNQPG